MVLSVEKSTERDMLISWIIPCFNEGEVIQATFRRVNKVCDLHSMYKWEIIFVDDGSRDNTQEIVKSLINTKSRVKFIVLSRNYGHQIAVQAGLNNSIGNAAIIIDADLQDPPELASSLLRKWEEGFDVVYGKRVERKAESLFKKLTAKLFYRLMNHLADIDIPLDTGDFRLIDRKVIEATKEMPEKERFLRGMISWIGFNQTYINYTREKRYAGRTKYPLSKMLKFATDGIISFSRRPLKLATYIGFISSIVSLLGIIYVLYIRLLTNNWVAGWAGLALAVLFSCGLQLLSIGILGEYIGRIYVESKNRPLYFVKERIEL